MTEHEHKCPSSGSKAAAGIISASDVKTEYYSEICCEMCNDVIHNHFDCPACGEEGAGTSIYSEIEDGDELECEECDAKFIVVSHTWTEIVLRRYRDETKTN